MCGIVGYLGSEAAYPVLVAGLTRLEYRGYDSAGIAVVDAEGVHVTKERGRVQELERLVGEVTPTASLGIGHTRWATHGEPNRVNAHPHLSWDGAVAIVHNGIIENYAELKAELLKKGVTFASETDTEVLANLIAHVKASQHLGLQSAVQVALGMVRGAYAIAVVDATDPHTMVLAKKSSPLALGITDDGFVIGSDATPIIEHTQKVIYLGDDQIATLHRGGAYQITSLAGADVKPKIETLDMDVARQDKDGFDHFMLKEIHEQPKVIRETMRGRLSLNRTRVLLGGIIDHEQRILRAHRLTIVACGTSYHAGLVGKYLIEELAGIPVEVAYASEYRYRTAPLGAGDVVLAISQSGETADTLAAIQLAKAAGALTLGMVNVVGSSIARESDGGVYTHAGPEVSVASTKAFTTQVTTLTLMALRFAQQLGTMPKSELLKTYQQFGQIPAMVESVLRRPEAAAAQEVAKRVAKSKVVLFLGRNNCYPVALEGALKLKEITYIPAEGYAAGEMKHGPIALIEEGTPVFVIVPGDPELREKIVSNIQEVKARGGYVIAISPPAEPGALKQADIILPIPDVNPLLLPIVATVPLQLVAYYTALELGLDVDKPRNLAKSVTVE